MKRKRVSVAVNGYGVIGKRVADALALQEDMELAADRTKGAEILVGPRHHGGHGPYRPDPA